MRDEFYFIPIKLKKHAEKFIFKKMKTGKDTINQGKFLARWIKRFGFAGFMFFLLKGLIFYVILPALVAYFAW